MIGFLRGVLCAKDENQVVIDVSGVGYEVRVSGSVLTVLGEAGDEISLSIYTHFNESALQLYGFRSDEEKTLFKKIISVSGIGPKMGLAVVSAYPLAELVGYVVAGDVAALTRIGGVGKKTAERIVVELKDKFQNERFVAAGVPSRAAGRSDSRHDDVLEALLSLGYSEAAARRAIQRVGASDGDTVQTLIKKSLGVLAQ